MSYNWDPHYIVPSESFTSYSGGVLLREEYDSIKNWRNWVSREG